MKLHRSCGRTFIQKAVRKGLLLGDDQSYRKYAMECIFFIDLKKNTQCAQWCGQYMACVSFIHAPMTSQGRAGPTTGPAFQRFFGGFLIEIPARKLIGSTLNTHTSLEPLRGRGHLRPASAANYTVACAAASKVRLCENKMNHRSDFKGTSHGASAND